MYVTQLTSQDAAAYQSLRLGALRESPTAVSSSYEQEAARAPAEIATRVTLAADGSFCVFGVFAEEELGSFLAFVRPQRGKLRHCTELAGTYVAPKFRRRGFGGALVNAVVAHARSLDGVRQVKLGVNATNMVLLLIMLSACASETKRMNSEKLNEFAIRCTAAWCSQNAASVASFFAEGGSLKINEGTPPVGRTAITAAAQGFMSAFPDLVVKMDGLDVDGGRITYHWTLIGTNTGPGGTGKAVRISGYEEWRIGAEGLIAASRGHFDEAEYQRQLKTGVGGVR